MASTKEINEPLDQQPKGFIVYPDYLYTIWAELTDAEIGQTIRALSEYCLTGIRHNGEYFGHDRAVTTAYNTMIRNQDINFSKYQKRVAANRVNGQKGGRPRKADQSRQGITRSEDLNSKMLSNIINKKKETAADPDTEPASDPKAQCI